MAHYRDWCDGAKARWVIEAGNMTGEAQDSQARRLQDSDAYELKGPLEPTDPRVTIDLDYFI